MPTVKVQQPHSLGSAAAMQRMQSFEEMLAKYRVKIEWSGNRGKIKGLGVGGDVAVLDREVTVAVELGFLAKAAGVDADKLQGSIARRLAEALADKPA